ncbi:MAG: phenylacetate-CoA ligase [Chthoniobacter sp.]|nr:phenylacetate-CoA ligase [Chthoniobacter sp.]
MNPPNWQSLSKPALEQAQAEKLRRYLDRVVVPFSPHYGQLFKSKRLAASVIRSLDDLRRIPFTAKEDLLDDPKKFVLAPDQKVLRRRPATIASALLHGRAAITEKFEREFRPLMLTSTTGRSSDPIPFIYTQQDIDNLSLAGDRVMRICGARPDMRMINMFPFAPHLAFWATHYAGTAFGVFVLSSGGGKTLGTEGNLRLIKKIKPDVLIGMPTFIYHVLRIASDEKVQCPQLKKIVLGGEKVPAGMRRKLRALAAGLGAPEIDVLPSYGFTEAKMAWPQCPAGDAQSGYHLNPDLGIFEVVDPTTGEPRKEREPGELVWTPLAARGTVVLRYRTGDFIDGGLAYGPCPHCRRNVPQLVGNISRSSEIREMRLDKLKGTLVDFNRLEHVLDNAEHVGTWQLEIRKVNDDALEVDELILHVQKLDDSPEEVLRNDLNNRFAAETEIHPNRIMFHNEAELRRMQGVGTSLKEQRVVDHRPQNSDASGPNGGAHE